MDWFNICGFAFVLIILVPNIIFALTVKNGFENKYKNPLIESLEQVGRFGCFIFMFISPPVLCMGFPFDGAKTVYIIAGATVTALYCLGWIVFWRENSLRKALTLSVLPSVLFLECGILTLNIPLLLFTSIFSPCHILISCKNALN